MPVSGDPGSGSDRQGARTMDITVERSAERFRDHLRRTHHPERQLIPCVRTRSTDYLTDPSMSAATTYGRPFRAGILSDSRSPLGEVGDRHYFQLMK